MSSLSFFIKFKLTLIIPYFDILRIGIARQNKKAMENSIAHLVFCFWLRRKFCSAEIKNENLKLSTMPKIFFGNWIPILKSTRKIYFLVLDFFGGLTRPTFSFKSD